jgi:hypothetical protein
MILQPLYPTLLPWSFRGKEVDRAHRRELKHDKFVEQVGHTVEYAQEHKTQFVRYGIAALAVLVLLGGFWWYRNYKHSERQGELQKATLNQNARIGAPSDIFPTFPTQAEKDKAVEKGWRDLIAKYPGSDEAAIAKFYLATGYADAGKISEAEKLFAEIAAGADKPYASQAKLSLAQLYAGTGKTAEAEKLYRELMNNPSPIVSKEQATIELARLIAKNNPVEARKLLEPLRTAAGAVSRAAITASGEIPAAQ